MEEATEYDEGILDQAMADAVELERLEEDARLVHAALRSIEVKYESCYRMLILSTTANTVFLLFIFWRFFNA